MRLFGWSGKFYFPKIEIRWPKKKAFDHGNAFTLLFSLQSISGKWERESARAWEEKIQSEITINGTIAIRDRNRRRDLAKARSRSSRDCAIDCDLVKKARSRSRYRSRSRHGGRTGNIFVVDDFFFPGLWLVFSDLCFPSSFPNNRKYFLENFLKCNQTHGNIFLFRKLAFPENMYFPENVLQQPNTALIMKLFAKR